MIYILLFHKYNIMFLILFFLWFFLVNSFDFILLIIIYICNCNIYFFLFVLSQNFSFFMNFYLLFNSQ